MVCKLCAHGFSFDLRRWLTAGCTASALLLNAAGVRAQSPVAPPAAVEPLESTVGLSGLGADEAKTPAPPKPRAVGQFVSRMQPVTPGTAVTQPAPGAAPPIVLPETEVVVEPPAAQQAPPPQFTPPSNPFADTVFDSPFFSAPVSGYGVGNTTTATKLDIPNMDFPGIINTVTEDLIADRQSLNLEQALRNVPNVIPRTGAGFRSDEFFIRGFNVGFAGNDFRKDGFRDSSWPMREVQNVERIEVLKGPASILYGSATQPAGIINMVTKKPVQDRFANLNATFGSFDLYRTTGDVNTPVFGNENVLFRLNYAIQESGTFRNFVFVDRQFVAPAFTFVLGPDTTLTVMGEYLHDRRPTDRGIVYVPNTPAGDPFRLPIDRFLGQPSDRNEYNDGQFNVFLNHELRDGVNARLGYVSNWSGEQRNNYDTRGLVGNNVTRQFVRQRSMAADHYFIGDVAAEFGRLFEHKALFGTELGTTINDTWTRQSVVTGFPLNIFNPFTTPGANYSLYPETPILAAVPLTSGSQQNQFGVYLQDMIEISPYLKALVGIRSSWYDLKSYNQGVDTQQTWQTWTPRYGLVFEPLPEDLSFYVGYSNTFNPVAGFLQNGDPLQPESGFGFDAGTKLRLRDQLYLTIGYFDIERNNVAQAIPNSVPARFQQFGLVRSTGMEVELVGQLTERLSLINGFGMADARIENDRVAANIGKHLTNSPYWQGSWWMRYNVIQREDRVAGIGFGMYYTDFWHLDAANTFRAPGFTRYDMGFFNDIGRWKTSLFIENLTNANYISGANGSTTVLPGAPLSLRGMVGVPF